MQAWTERIPLRHAASPAPRARLREPRGSDELAVEGVDTRSAVQLLDRLVEGSPCAVADLSAADRDGLLAALHRQLWGDRILCSLACPACEAMYDLSFELSAMQRQLAAQAERSRLASARCLVDAQERRWCLPDARDEEAAADRGLADGVAALAASVTGEEGADPAAVADRLEALAPILDIDLDTRCAECGHAQLARFDIQSFVLQRLLDEREGVLGEVHALASGYGWSLGEILGLSRGLRRELMQRLAAPAAVLR